MSIIGPWAHVLAVRDLDASAAWYVDVLGFSLAWEDADDWRLLTRDGVRLMLGACPNDMPASATGAHSYVAYLSSTDIDALHAAFTARGANCAAPANRPYGMREFLVTTPDGHRFMFGADLPR